MPIELGVSKNHAWTTTSMQLFCGLDISFVPSASAGRLSARPLDSPVHMTLGSSANCCSRCTARATKMRYTPEQIRELSVRAGSPSTPSRASFQNDRAYMQGYGTIAKRHVASVAAGYRSFSSVSENLLASCTGLQGPGPLHSCPLFGQLHLVPWPEQWPKRLAMAGLAAKPALLEASWSASAAHLRRWPCILSLVLSCCQSPAATGPAKPWKGNHG